MSVRRLLATLLCCTALAACKFEPTGAGLGDPCVQSTDCAAPFMCSEGVCILGAGRACDPGRSRCNGDVVERCLPGGDGWEFAEQCDVGCLQGACRSRLCDPLEKRCEGNILVQCLPNGGGFGFLQACSTTCSSQTLSCTNPVCAPFETRCDPDRPNDLQTCNSRGTGWTSAPCSTQTDEAVCSRGRCLPKVCDVGRVDGQVVSREERCRGDVLEQCNDSGSGFDAVEVCGYGCSQTGTSAACASAACEAGATRCESTALVRCTPERRGFAFVQFCPAGCDQSGGSASCKPPVCSPLSRKCAEVGGNAVVQQCRADGTAYDAVESCPQICIGGSCVTVDAACSEGDLRCNGREVEQCVRVNAGATEWRFVERCFGSCSSGACDDSGACGCEGGVSSGRCGATESRAPIALRALLPDGTRLPGDGSSTVLVYSDPIVSASGELVPDGTLVTFTNDGSESFLVSADADTTRAGLQRPTFRGRARVLVRAPTLANAGDLVVRATIGGSCSGSFTLPFDPPQTVGQRPVYFAEDFSTTRNLDRGNTTAQWDTVKGRILATPVYDLGTGADGNLTVPALGTVDLWDHPARYGVGMNVLGLGTQEAVVASPFVGLSPGDEVLIINVGGLTSSSTVSASAVGNYEFKRVAAVEGSRVVFTEPLRTVFGATSNGNLGEHRVVIQRVPHFNNLTVEAGGTLTTKANTDGGSGVLAFRARGVVHVVGQIHVVGKGLGANVAQPATTTGALNRLLLGAGGTSSPGAGVVFIAGGTITLWSNQNPPPNAGTNSGRINASSCLSGTCPGSGAGGTVWLQAGTLYTGINAATATGSAPAPAGRIRIDYGTFAGQTNPVAFEGQKGAFVASTSTAYTTPESGQPLIRRAQLLGALGGAQTTTLGNPSLPSITFEASADNGVSYGATNSSGLVNFSIDTAPAVGRQFRFKTRLVTLSDASQEVAGVAFKLTIE